MDKKDLILKILFIFCGYHIFIQKDKIALLIVGLCIFFLIFEKFNIKVNHYFENFVKTIGHTLYYILLSLVYIFCVVPLSLFQKKTLKKNMFIKQNSKNINFKRPW